MYPHAKMLTMRHLEQRRGFSAIASLRASWSRAWMAMLAALHESRAGEAARVVRHHRHLVQGADSMMGPVPAKQASIVLGGD